MSWFKNPPAGENSMKASDFEARAARSSSLDPRLAEFDVKPPVAAATPAPPAAVHAAPPPAQRVEQNPRRKRPPRPSRSTPARYSVRRCASRVNCAPKRTS